MNSDLRVGDVVEFVDEDHVSRYRPVGPYLITYMDSGNLRLTTLDGEPLYFSTISHDKYSSRHHLLEHRTVRRCEFLTAVRRRKHG